MKKTLESLAISCVVPALFWFDGFDFNVRGEEATLCAMGTLVVFVLAYTFPRKTK